jgi:hypothetical protein
MTAFDDLTWLASWLVALVLEARLAAVVLPGAASATVA